jgi:hypothetical protein
MNGDDDARQWLVFHGGPATPIPTPISVVPSTTPTQPTLDS